MALIGKVHGFNVIPGTTNYNSSTNALVPTAFRSVAVTCVAGGSGNPGNPGNHPVAPANPPNPPGSYYHPGSYNYYYHGTTPGYTVPSGPNPGNPAVTINPGTYTRNDSPGNIIINAATSGNAGNAGNPTTWKGAGSTTYNRQSSAIVPRQSVAVVVGTAGTGGNAGTGSNMQAGTGSPLGIPANVRITVSGITVPVPPSSAGNPGNPGSAGSISVVIT